MVIALLSVSSLQVSAGATESPRKIRLSGTVVDSEARPVADLEVVILDSSDAVLAIERTTATGTFAFARVRLRPGRYRLRARHQTLGVAQEFVVVSSEDRQEHPPLALRLSVPSDETRSGSSNDKANYAKVQVFYATDRKWNNTKRQAGSYSGRRGSEQLSYGMLEVSIPRHHVEGEIEAPSLWRLEFRQDPEKHVVVLTVTPTERAEFFRGLAGRIGRTKNREAFVFIHGYNVSFENAARRTAQLSYDLKLDAAPVLYSWPSTGEAGKYLEDSSNVEWTIPHLERFLGEITAQTGARTVHLIAHSMGNLALVRALEALQARQEPRPRFREIVLAAPDVDVAVFRQLAAAVKAGAGRVTLYASSNDEALKLSKRLRGGYARAGDTGASILVVPGIDTVDASLVGTDFLGHSYYGDSPTVLADLMRLLKDDMPPASRKLRPIPSGDGQYWFFQP